MKRQFTQPTLVMVILLLWTVPLFGKGSNQPVLTKAVADLDADPPTLSIFGDNLGPSPQVFLGTVLGTLEELGINSSTDTFIEAVLPPRDPGTFLVVLSTGPGNNNMFAMDVTIGPVGPQGPPGEQGAIGPVGPGTTTANTLFIGSDQDSNEPDSTLSLGTDNSTKMTIHESGNVGIGTTSPPSEKLEVAGKLKTQNERRQVFASEGGAIAPTGSFVDIPDMQVTLTTGNLPVLILVDIGATFTSSGAQQDAIYRLLVDGGEKTRTFIRYTVLPGSDFKSVQMFHLENLSSGEHTISVQVQSDFGIHVSSGDFPRKLIVLEL